MNQELAIMDLKEVEFNLMSIEEEVSIICSVFPDADRKVTFQATALTLIDEDGDRNEGFYLNGNIVMCYQKPAYTMIYHEFGHYLASLFPKEEFKQLATKCYKELRVTPYNKALKVYRKEKRPEEAFCLYFQLTMNDPNKRNNAFIQMLKARYATTKESEEFVKQKWETFYDLAPQIGAKVISLTGRVFYRLENKIYDELIRASKSNPELAGYVEKMEKLNEGAL